MRKLLLFVTWVLAATTGYSQWLTGGKSDLPSNEREYLNQDVSQVRHLPVPLQQYPGMSGYQGNFPVFAKTVPYTAAQPQSEVGQTGMRSLMAPVPKAEGQDLITEVPEGTERFYTRTGTQFTTEDAMNVVKGNQYGIIKMVYTTDHKTVYIKDLVSATAGSDVWVKGNVSTDGKTITLPLKQNVNYVASLSCYLQLNVLNYDEATGGYVYDANTTEARLIVEDNVIKLQDTHEKRILGLTYSNDNSWSLYGDYGSVYTNFDEKVVTVPAELKTEDYLMKALDKNGKEKSTAIRIGFSGNDVYVQGMCSMGAPKGWIKGVKDGNKLRFTSYQYQGLYRDFYPIYFLGCKVENDLLVESNFEFTYDEAARTYTSNMYVLENVQNHDIVYLERYNAITATAFPEIEITKELIKEQPEGTFKTYTRAGKLWYKYWGEPYQSEQNGFLIDMVYASDGRTVYMKDPIAQATASTWVKGYLEGGKIHMPLYQCIDYNEVENYGVMTAVLVKSDKTGTYEPNFKAKEVLFTVDQTTGVVSLEGTQGGNTVYGLVYTNNLKWNGYADYESVYTPHYDKVTPIPEALSQQTWTFQYNEKGKDAHQTVQVAIDGDKMYLAGLPFTDEKSAIVGTITGDKVVFESDQYLGVAKGMNAVAYFGGATYTVEDIEYPDFGFVDHVYRYKYTPKLELAYDVEKQIMTTPEGTALLVNGGKPSEKVAYIIACCDPMFNYDSGEAYKPAAPKVTLFEDWSADYGYYNVEYDAPSRDADGRFILPENLSYEVFIKKNGEITPYVFKKEVHEKLTEDMTTVPYTFSDNYSIGESASYLFIYESDLEDVGIQLINRTGGKEVRSDRVWAKGTPETGIQNATTEAKEVKDVIYYNVSGVRMQAPVKGVNIVTEVYTDGTSQTRKVVF